MMKRYDYRRVKRPVMVAMLRSAKSHEDVVDLFGIHGTSELLGLSYQGAQKMKHRSSIHPDYWGIISDETARLGHRLTIEDLWCMMQSEDARAEAAE